MISINPSSGQIIARFTEMKPDEIGRILKESASSQKTWKEVPLADRSRLMFAAAKYLENHLSGLSNLITEEMGKPLHESESEIMKCAWVCRYYAENSDKFLSRISIESDAEQSYVSFSPLGVILAVMPWNFPFWQVFRFAAPALMAGNGAVLKHASNVSGCSLAIEEAFKASEFPEHIFRSLLIPAAMVEDVVRNPDICAVTLTGSEAAGSAVAACAGKSIKKSVLELGGSDPFIVLADADIDTCADTAITARFLNTGQSCIAAKRFIVENDVVSKFTGKITERIMKLKIGNPLNNETEIGPLAKEEFISDLHWQVTESEKMGADILIGGKPANMSGFYYEPTLMVNISPDMPVFKQETFGPVFSIITAANEEEAVRLANKSEFGLGASLWTADIEKGKELADKIEAGAVFINSMVKSDPRLPFGGIKKSGYGRELSDFGIREFVNIKTVSIH